nr:hypothetical protein [Interfilum sp. SAG 36.88]
MIFKHAAFNSQVFIKNSKKQTTNQEKLVFYSDLDNGSSRNTSNKLQNAFFSQSVFTMTQSLPLWSISWTRPLQSYENILINKPRGLINLIGPLSQYSSLPSCIAQGWKVNKNYQQSLMRYGVQAYKNKKIKVNSNKNKKLLVDWKRFNFFTSETLFLIDSLIGIYQPTVTLPERLPTERKRTILHKLNLNSKKKQLDFRVLSKHKAFERKKFIQNLWQSTASSYWDGKNYSDLHIDFNAKVKNNCQKSYQIDLKNLFFLDFVLKDFDKVSYRFDSPPVLQELNLQEKKVYSSKNTLTKLEQTVTIQKNLLLSSQTQGCIKKNYDNIWARLYNSNLYVFQNKEWYVRNQDLVKDIFAKEISKDLNSSRDNKKDKKDPTKIYYKKLKDLYNTRQTKKEENFDYLRKRIKTINKFENKIFSKRLNKKLWENKIDSDETKFTKTIERSIKAEPATQKYHLFHQWKDNFLKKKEYHSVKDKSYLIDYKALSILSRLLYKILSLRQRAYSSLVLTPSFQLISIDLWWTLFIACGIGLVVQYEEDNSVRQDLREAVSLSPISIWRLYWNQTTTHPFWPQLIKTLQLRTKNWAQPRFIKLQNLFSVYISPSIASYISPKSIGWMPYRTAHAVLNIAESIESFTELILNDMTLVSVAMHTGITCIFVKQLDKVRRLIRRLGPSSDDAVVALLRNPVSQFGLFLIRKIIYSTAWCIVVPLRLMGLFYSLGWKIWYVLPSSIRIYLKKRGRERHFLWILEKAINHKEMLAGSQHTLDHPGIGLVVAKRIRLTNLFLRMSNICTAELSPLASQGIVKRYDRSIWDALVPKSSLFIEPVGSRRNEWLQLASNHWKLPVVHLKLDLCLNRDAMSMSGESVSIKWGFGRNVAENKIALKQVGKDLSSAGPKRLEPGPLFQIVRPDEILDDGTIAPSMDRPQTIPEDYMVRHFMIAAASIPCFFVVENLNMFYETEHSGSDLADRELRERSFWGGLSYEEMMFGFLPNSGYLTVDYWDILGMPNQLEKEAEEEDYEIEELEDDPPEIRNAKIALNSPLGPQNIRQWVALPKEGGITGWEAMEPPPIDEWEPPAALLYLLWLLDKFPRTRYGIRFGVGTLLTIKEPLLRKRRWDKVYRMRGLNWIDRERILQMLMTSTGVLRLEAQALQQLLPRTQGYTLAEIHSLVNEMALSKVQTSLHLEWGKEWAWENGFLLKRINKPNKPASGSDAATNYLVWKQSAYLQDLHQINLDWACIEKASRSLMREEQASMTRLPPYYYFRDGHAHIYRNLSKWVVSAFVLPGVTRFSAYNAGEIRFRYNYLEQFALGEPAYTVGYRRDPTGTAAWAEIIRSLALIAGGDLFYECVENHSEQSHSKKYIHSRQIGTSRQLKQLDKAIVDICWQLLWALGKQNPLVPPMNGLNAFQNKATKRKSFDKNKLSLKRFLGHRIGFAQVREESNVFLSKSLPILFLRFPGLNEEDILGGKEPFVHTAPLFVFHEWRVKKWYCDSFRPITTPHPSLQVMVKDDELLYLNYVWEPLFLYIFHKLRPHSFQHEEKTNPEEYGRPLEITELHEVQDNKSSAALLVWSGGNSLKDAPTDLELGELVANPFPMNEKVRLFSAEPDRVWHLDSSILKAISFDDLHFLHAWMPFFQWIQWIYKEKVDPICSKVWVAPYRRLHVLATYVDSYLINDLSPIHHRLFGADPTDLNPQKSWEKKMQQLKDNRWKADNRGVDQMWINLAQNPKLADYLRPMLEEHMDYFTMPEWIRSREHRRKIRMKERTRKLLSRPFDRADPHTGSIEDPAALAAESLALTAGQRAEIVASGMLMMAHDSGPLWRSYHAVATGMHRGWDLTYSTSDLRWLVFNETDRSERGLYGVLYEIKRIATWLIVWTWPHLQNAFVLMQSRAAWIQQEEKKSNWRLSGLSYSAKLERGRTIARLETEEMSQIIWNSTTGSPTIRPFPGSLPLDLLQGAVSEQRNKKDTQSDLLPRFSELAEIFTYKKPGWRSEKKWLHFSKKA